MLLMLNFLHQVRTYFARRLRSKNIPASLTGSQWSGTSFVDTYHRNKTPAPNELQAELKSTAFTCASINAAVCASFPPRLYVTTHPGEPEPKCLTGPVDFATEKLLRRKAFGSSLAKSTRIQEVLDHPLLTLLR